MADQRGRGRSAPLDGLRAVAVLAVVVFHSGLKVARGGELGVDIFFVISGYLITSILVTEHLRTGSIRIGRFYVRRALRIYPVLLAMVLLVLIVSALGHGSGEFAFDRQLLEGAGVSAGYLEDIAASGGAFTGAQGPFFHTWSLSLEEHYYLVWPFVILLCLRRGGTRTLATVICLLTFAMGGWMAYLSLSGAAVGRIDYAPDTRSVGLAIGSLLAVGAARSPAVLRSVSRGWPAAAVVLLAAILSGPGTALLQRGGYAVVDVSAACVVAATVLDRSVLARALGWKPVAAVGLRSYSVYLWHFPLFHYLSVDRVHHGGGELAVFRLVALAVIVELSWVAIEQPFLRLKDRRSAALVEPANVASDDRGRHRRPRAAGSRSARAAAARPSGDGDAA